MLPKYLLLVALVAAVLLSACSDGSVSGGEDDLSQGTVEDLVRELGRRVLEPVFGLDLGKVAVPIDQAQACPDGGTTRITGEITGEADGGSGTLSIDVDVILDDCGLVLGGEPYILNTEPVLDLTGTLLISRGTLQDVQTLFLAGPLTLDPTRGPTITCPLDLVLAITAVTRSVHVTGTACGIVVDVPFSLGN